MQMFYHNIEEKDTIIWSYGAIMCYKRGMICKNCDNEYWCDKIKTMYRMDKPPMKYAVINLVRKYGIPKDIEDE